LIGAKLDWSGKHPCFPAVANRLCAAVNKALKDTKHRNTAEAAVWQAGMLAAPVELRSSQSV